MELDDLPIKVYYNKEFGYYQCFLDGKEIIPTTAINIHHDANSQGRVEVDISVIANVVNEPPNA